MVQVLLNLTLDGSVPLMNASAALVDSTAQDPAECAVVARQPVLDGRLHTVAYDLLYRTETEDSTRAGISHEVTARIVLNSFVDVGLERLAGSHDAYISVELPFLLAGHCRLLPCERVVLGMTAEVVSNPAALEEIAELRRRGYRFVWSLCAVGNCALLMEYADVVRIDVQRLPASALQAVVERMQRAPFELLAENVETHEEFELCCGLGFNLFQGGFLCRPNVVSAPKVSSDRLSIMRLLSRLHDPALAMDELVTIISSDPTLSYKLLRFINSAACGVRRQVESIRHAVTLLGFESLRRWLSILAFSRLDDRPRELLVTANVRARMCELLGEQQGARSCGPYFTVGLFSLLDAFVGQKMPAAVSELPLSDDVVAALLTGGGPLGRMLQSVIAYERGEWGAVELLGHSPQDYWKAYRSALSWSADVIEGLG